MSDWYDEQKHRERKARERLGLPEFDTATLADYAEAPRDVAARYLLAMGETRIEDDGRLSRWTCGCTTQRRAIKSMFEDALTACAKHAGKVV